MVWQTIVLNWCGHQRAAVGGRGRGRQSPECGKIPLKIALENIEGALPLAQIITNRAYLESSMVWRTSASPQNGLYRAVGGSRGRGNTYYIFDTPISHRLFLLSEYHTKHFGLQSITHDIFSIDVYKLFSVPVMLLTPSNLANQLSHGL
jgi:hypothetical protein